MSTGSYREILNESAVGHFGPYGGRFVPEALISALDELAAAHTAAQSDPIFQSELAELHKSYTGRPSILTDAKRFELGGKGWTTREEPPTRGEPETSCLAR